MDYNAFFQGLKGDVGSGIYLFHGVEEHIKRSALQRLREKVLPAGLELMCETVLDNPGADDVIAAAETLPMMGGLRLVIVRDSTLLLAGRGRDEAADSDRLIAYLPKLPDFSLLVFYCHGAIDGRKKLSLTLSKKAHVVKFDQLADEDLTRWMRSTLKADQKTIGNAQAQHLAFTAGRDLTMLTGELQKLVHYIGDRQAIEIQDIDAVAIRSLECTIFQLVDALVDGKEARAFSLLGIMMEGGEARLGILAMVLRQYRMLLNLRWMQEEGIDRATQVKRLGIPPFAFDRAQKQAKTYTTEQLKAAVALCIDTDYAIKSGRMREDAALERAMWLLRRS